MKTNIERKKYRKSKVKNMHFNFCAKGYD
jgi:hypothetical protein